MDSVSSGKAVIAINPWRTCAAGIIVFVVCVCVCVCLCLLLLLLLSGISRQKILVTFALL